MPEEVTQPDAGARALLRRFRTGKRLFKSWTMPAGVSDYYFAVSGDDPDKDYVEDHLVHYLEKKGYLPPMPFSTLDQNKWVELPLTDLGRRTLREDDKIQDRDL